MSPAKLWNWLSRLRNKNSAKKHFRLRRVFEKDGAALLSAHFIVEYIQDNNGNLTKIFAHGCGFRQVVGMS
jgi:hypothetical protein